MGKIKRKFKSVIKNLLLTSNDNIYNEYKTTVLGSAKNIKR